MAAGEAGGTDACYPGGALEAWLLDPTRPRGSAERIHEPNQAADRAITRWLEAK